MVSLLETPVPIVGQPFSVKGWSITILLHCQCGEPLMIVGTPGTGVTCRCGRSVLFNGVRVRETDGQVGFQLGAAVAPSGLDS